MLPTCSNEAIWRRLTESRSKMNTATLRAQVFSQQKAHEAFKCTLGKKTLLQLIVVCFIFTLIKKRLHPGVLWEKWDPVNLRLRSGYTHLGSSDASLTHFLWVHQSGAEEKLQICRLCTTQRRRWQQEVKRFNPRQRRSQRSETAVGRRLFWVKFPTRALHTEIRSVTVFRSTDKDFPARFFPLRTTQTARRQPTARCPSEYQAHPLTV